MASSSNFDRLAPIYRPMERLLAGNLMHQARTGHVERLSQPKHVLMLGEGPGRLLIPLIQRLPTAHFLVVDQSQSMLDRAKKAVKDHSLDPPRITWLEWDVLKQGLPDGTFDLITTPFFLDCFTKEQLQKLIPAIASKGSCSCDWLLTDFQIPRYGVLKKWRAKGIHCLMYAFFRCVTRIPAHHWEDPDPLIKATGFRNLNRKEFNLGLIRADHWKRA